MRPPLARCGLAAGPLNAGESKTDAGRRYVDLPPPLREELALRKAGLPDVQGQVHVFATRDGGAPCKNNLRARVFNVAVKRANENVERAGLAPLPDGLTPHKLRHTYASLLFVTGCDVVHVMGQLGHTDPAFTLRAYAHGMRHDEGDRDRLRALVGGSHWAPMGTSGDNSRGNGSSEALIPTAESAD